MKSIFCLCSPYDSIQMFSHFSPLFGGCSESLNMFRSFFIKQPAQIWTHLSLGRYDCRDDFLEALSPIGMRHLFLVGMLLGPRGWGSGWFKPHCNYQEDKSVIMVFWSSCGSDQAVCLRIGLWQAGVFGFGRRATTEGWAYLFLCYDSRR